MKNAAKLKVITAAISFAALGLATQAQTLSPGQVDETTQPRNGAAVRSTGRTEESQITSNDSASTTDGRVCTMNKCGKVIGADVKDAQGNVIGTVKDVVVNFDTGRVSYCALKLKGQSRYLAVPLSALKPDASGNDLVLNADKDKIANARGFDENNWPPANTPPWGAQSSDKHWQQ